MHPPERIALIAADEPAAPTDEPVISPAAAVVIEPGRQNLEQYSSTLALTPDAPSRHDLQGTGNFKRAEATPQLPVKLVVQTWRERHPYPGSSSCTSDVESYLAFHHGSRGPSCGFPRRLLFTAGMTVAMRSFRQVVGANSLHRSKSKFNGSYAVTVGRDTNRGPAVLGCTPMCYECPCPLLRDSKACVLPSQSPNLCLRSRFKQGINIQRGHRLESIPHKGIPDFRQPLSCNPPVSKAIRSRAAVEKEPVVLMPKIQESEYISVLPVEVLGLIFEEVVGKSDACREYQPLPFEPDKSDWSVVRPELLISHVSRCWRAVASGTPSLWTSIHFYVKQSIDLVNLYLARSRGLPLVLVFRQHFVCGTHPRQTFGADYSRITTTILDHIRVCCRLEIRTNIPLPELLDGLGRSCAPLLKEIVLHHPRSNVREHTFSSSSFPTLTHLELGPLMSIVTTMPTRNLTSLTLAGLPAFGLPAATFVNLLSQLQSLSRLALLDEAVDFERSHTTEVVEMLSLRSLLLQPGPDISRCYLTGLMETVATPALEELVLDITNVSSPRDIHLFLRHLKREAPRFLSLRNIVINSPFEGFDIADAFVHTAPNIEALLLSRYSIDSVLTYLTHDARREAFPKLRTLQLGSPQFDWDVVLSFLRWRKLLGRPLRSLKFKGFGGSKGEVLDRLFERLLDACLVV